MSLGLSEKQTLYFIILPQAIKRTIPAFINQLVTLIKDSSLAYIVNVSELTFLANQINGASYGVAAIEILIFIGSCYFLLCGALNILFYYYNKK